MQGNKLTTVVRLYLKFLKLSQNMPLSLLHFHWPKLLTLMQNGDKNE